MLNENSDDGNLSFTQIFLKQSRKLKKRNPSFDKDVSTVFEMLEAGGIVGDRVSGVGEEL